MNWPEIHYVFENKIHLILTAIFANWSQYGMYSLWLK